ncbi:17082_t:CDS:2, partial [Racocetra fulgida]
PSTTTPNKLQRYTNKLGKGNGRPVPIELDYAGSSSRNCFKCGMSGHYAKNCKSKGKQKHTNIEDEPNQPPHTITNNSLELTQVEKNCERLLKFNGKINGHSAWILLDSGASRNFIDKNFATWNKLTLKTVSPLSLELADGSKAQTDKTFNINKLELDPYYTSGILAQVLKLQCYDAILGKPWLYHANPNINWRKNILVFQYGSKVIEVQADSQKTPKDSSCNSVFISQQQLAKVPNSEEIFTIYISQESNKDTNTQQPEV